MKTKNNKQHEPKLEPPTKPGVREETSEQQEK